MLFKPDRLVRLAENGCFSHLVDVMVKISYFLCFKIWLSYAALAQLVEHRFRKAEVEGSIPLGGFDFLIRHS